MRKMSDAIQQNLNLITLVIPAKNEEKTIGEIIEKSKKYAKEIIVVDGYSQDNTVLEAKKKGAIVIKDNKKGKGDAIRTIIPHITGYITVFIDADGSHNPYDIPKIIEPILKDEADHVSGSRLIGGSSELHGSFDECFRLMGSSFITACINWRYKVNLSESQNGFRAIKTSVLKSLDLKENKTTIEQEMIIKTLKAGYRISEVPTHEYKRKYGVSHIKLWKHSWRYIYSLIKYLFF